MTRTRSRICPSRPLEIPVDETPSGELSRQIIEFCDYIVGAAKVKYKPTSIMTCNKKKGNFSDILSRMGPTLANHKASQNEGSHKNKKPKQRQRSQD